MLKYKPLLDENARLAMVARFLHAARGEFPYMSEQNKAASPIAILMGSRSDWPTMKAAAEVLDALNAGYEARVVSGARA